MAEEAQQGLLEVIAQESPPIGKPVALMTAPELMGALSLRGHQQLYAIVSQPLDPDNLKQQRLIGDMAAAVNKLFVKVARDERDDDVAARLLAEIRAERAEQERSQGKMRP